MMSWMKWLRWGKKHPESHKIKKVPEKKKYKGFDIEYFPITDRYYPRFKGKYLRLSMGVWTGAWNLDLATFAKSSEGAILIIDEYLESQELGSVIIKIEDVKKGE